ncbi:MAG: DNRLRE domain-containing protein [Candidatus Coatesbacteria bacterium]|nr:MAG: DNRLRE domain-containing protein [Candidatus Coatesbacteria bacterium]
MKCVLAFSILILVIVASATDYEITLQPNPVWGEDATVDSRYPTANFGDDEELRLDNDGSDVSRFYVYFETDFIEDLELTDALFSLYATSISGGGTLDVEVYEVSENWHESTVTWNDQPAIGSLLGSAAFPTDTGWLDVSLPVPPYDEGLMVTASDESTTATAVFHSSDSSAEYERPKLTLTFEFSGIVPASLGHIKTMFR